MIAASVVGLGACGDEVTMPPDAEDRDPACMLLIDTQGYWSDGTSQDIYDAFDTGLVAVGCMCLTEEEFESKSRHDELNDLVLAECQRLSALFEFEWDDCQEDHDNGSWLSLVYWSDVGSQFDHRVPPDLPCQ